MSDAHDQSQDRLWLQLQLEPGVEPIRGRIVSEHGSGEAFVGWLALAAAIERLTINSGTKGERP